MALPKEFLEQLPSRSDEQLYDILAHPDDYLAEALSAARAELEKRNLPAERAAQLEAAVQSRTVAEAAKAIEPLGWPTRILIFFFCAGLAGLILSAYYSNKGYKRKSVECLITVVVALAVYIVLAGLLFLTR